MTEKTPGDLYNETINGFYSRLLKRVPSEKEFAYWRNFIEGSSFTETYDAFISSKEFKSRVGVVPGHPVGHYYSPVVDPQRIDFDALHTEMTDEEQATIGLSLKEMRLFWESNIQFIGTAAFPQRADPEQRYYFENPVFSYADAIMLRAMMLAHRPRRIIEIGSGFSSAAMLDVAEETAASVALTFIDPYPQRLNSVLKPGDASKILLIETPVQKVDLKIFDDLVADDILFIDSTHVLKTQSDVCFEFFEIMPRLKSGVVIHFHDVFYPFEYPAGWIRDKKYSWNEIYALRLFLSHNRSYTPIFFNDMFGKLESELVERTCPLYMKNTGGSFWMIKN